MKRIILTLILVASGVCLVGCTYEPSTAQIEQDKTEKNQSTLITTQPPVKLEWSLERENINRRTDLWNDENKISYIYLIDFGRVMAFYTIKGKVSSVNSQITNPEQLAISRKNKNGGSHYVDGVLPSPAEDGSYGTNGDGIFFFTTEGVYVEWAGRYMLADEPLVLTSQPQLIRNVE